MTGAQQQRVCCQVCTLPAEYVIQYSRADSHMPSTPFCSHHSADLCRTLRPLTDPSIRAFSRTVLGCGVSP